MVMTKFAKKFVTELSQFCLHSLHYTSHRANMHVHGEPVVLKNPSKGLVRKKGRGERGVGILNLGSEMR